jgi:polysaccharide biosynthesis transport protein
MLRTDHSQLPRSRFDESPSIQDEQGLLELFTLAVNFLRRQYFVVFTIAFLAIGAGVLYLHFAPPIYTAHAQLLTDIRKGQFLQKQSVLADTPVDAAQLESQLQILKSESIATSVIRDLNLAEFFFPNAKFKSKTASMRDVIAVFESKLDVTRVGGSYVIDISFESQNPEKAAQVANAVANHFISAEQNAQLETNQTVGNWLQGRLKIIRKQVTEADSAVVDYAKVHNIVNTDGKLMDDQRLANLNNRLVEARSRTSEALARLFRIQAVIRKERTDDTTDATVSDALKDSIITSLRQKYLELVTREAEWSQRYGPEHQAVRRLRDQQHEIRESIHAELQRLAESYKSEYAIAKQHEDEIQKQLAGTVAKLHFTNKEQIALAELRSSAQSYHNLYDNFLRKYTESIEQQSFPIAQARVISHATAPLHKSRPKSIVILGISILGGFCLGIGAGIVRELMDRVFRTSDQVEALFQKPCVAVIPLIEDMQRKKITKNRKSSSINSGSKTINRGPGLFWTLVDSPSSRFAEGIRSIKLALDSATLDGAARPNKIIGFTSSLPNEGKSTIATAVAQLCAQTGNKVIIVDCDLRNPCLSREFTNHSVPGLVDVLAGKRTIEEVIWREPTTNFAFMPVGNSLQFRHTSEFLATDLAVKFFEKLGERYDYVVVDLPPLAPIVDVRATIRFIDTYFMVVAWGETKIEVVQHALNSAHNIYDNLSGVILNKTNFKSLRRYELHGDKYYHNKYYSRYGYTE